MSKIYKKYISLKIQNSELIYLFKYNSSYIFIDEDAKLVSKVLQLELTHINNMLLKCEFSSCEFDKYIKLLKENNFYFEIVDLSSDISIVSYESTIEHRIETLLEKVSFVQTNNLSVCEAYKFIEDISSESKILLEDIQENNFKSLV